MVVTDTINHTVTAPFALGATVRILLFLTLVLASFAGAQTEIPFWHSQDVAETVDALAEAFNASQSDYRVAPRYTGNYIESSLKLVAALQGGDAPVLFDAEGTVFAELVEEGALSDLSDLTAELEPTLVEDIFPIMWDYGALDGARYGLPWNSTLPVLFYNATAFEQRGVAPPATWEEFEEAAARLTTRNTKGYIDVAAALIFETMVNSRGGSLITEAGEPNFTSPEALETLELLVRLAKEKYSIPRSFKDLDSALIDFARTKGMMALATESLWPQGERFSVAFEVATAPVPSGGSPTVPLLGAQLVVLGGATAEERAGAVAFWEFLMQPENVATWVEASYYLPARRAALPLLESWYEEDPSRRAALTGLEHAVLRPRTGAYVRWQGYLEEAVEQAVRGRLSPEEALARTQERALEDR